MLLVVLYLEECLTVHLYLPLPGDESCRITQCCTGIEDHFRAVRQDYGGSHSHRIHHLYHLAVQFLVTFMERDIIGDAEQKRDGGGDRRYSQPKPSAQAAFDTVVDLKEDIFPHFVTHLLYDLFSCLHISSFL